MPLTRHSLTTGTRPYCHVLWTGAEDEQLQCLFSVRTPKELEKIFGLSYEQIRTRARSLRLKSRATLRREVVKHNFFAAVTIPSSYWAGFLMADGCIRQKSLWIGVAEKDKNHLMNLADSLGIPHAVKLYRSVAGGLVKHREYVRAVLTVSSTALITDLRVNFNVRPQKTLRPYVPPAAVYADCAEAFLAGLIDGDGFIGLYASSGHIYIRFGYVGAQELCHWGARLVNDLLIKAGRKPSASVRECRSRHWEMRCTGRNAQLILNKVAATCGNLALPRKWLVLDEFNARKIWLLDKTAIAA